MGNEREIDIEQEKGRKQVVINQLWIVQDGMASGREIFNRTHVCMHLYWIDIGVGELAKVDGK